MRLTAVIFALALLGAPAAAHADAAWTCSASAGWVSAGGQRSDAPGLGGAPCPTANAAAAGASGSAGRLAVTGTAAVDGGASSLTTDARTPQATLDATTLSIRNGDGQLAIDVSKLASAAQGSCDTNRQPLFTSSGTPGSVTLNGRPVDTSREYSEPGVGVNGAPLFGRLTIRFDEVTKTDTGISRRAIHVIVTDRNGTTVFEAAAGEAAVARQGAVCDPPPVCPPGQEPQSGRCVQVTVTPLPQPLPPAAPIPGVTPSPPPARKKTAGCRDANAYARRVPVARLSAATLCLLNAERRRHHIGTLRRRADLGRAATAHARDMVKRRYFAHTAPDGADVAERVLHSGHLGRFGHWRLGENLGWGWGSGASPRLIVRAWMRSPAHRRNILSRGFHDVGVALVLGSPGPRKSGSITYVIDFGGFG
jgi:uncharacterized protein YkwD